jgi:hypothetical protein
MITVRRGQWRDIHWAEVLRDGKPIKVNDGNALVDGRDKERMERDLQRLIERVS